MGALVVYFSRSGHTRLVAHEVARQCGAELDEIREVSLHPGTWGHWRAAWHVLTQAEPPIQPCGKDPSRYDTVIIGTPIWIGQPAPAVRSYLRQHAHHLKRVAFFYTEGGSGERKAFGELARLCGKTPVATLAVTDKQLPAPLHWDAVYHFTAQMSA